MVFQRKDAQMVKDTKNTKLTLKTWLFDKPARFTAWILVFSTLMYGFSYIPAIIKIPAIDIISIVITLVAFIFITRSLIKDLPYKNVSHGDFTAIINGYKILSLVLFTAWMGLTSLMNACTPSRMFITDIKTGNIIPDQTHFVISPTLFNIIEIIWFVVAVYLLGIWISNIYVKYKRAKDMGLSGWKVILSMPFTFIMTWMPGYLISDKKQSNLTIKSNWYSRFNKWVISNINNTLFMFLLLFIFTNLFISTHISTVLFPLMLFAIYMLWKTITKESFVKHMNRGYIWTAILINLFMVISFIRMAIIYIQMLAR